MNLLLDTNVISEVMRREPDPVVVAWFGHLDRVITSVVCVEELIYGLRRRQAYSREAWLLGMLDEVGVVHPVSPVTTRWAAEQRARLAGQGQTITQADALIAATAWEHHLVLATRNLRDFDSFGIPLLNPFTKT